MFGDNGTVSKFCGNILFFVGRKISRLRTLSNVIQHFSLRQVTADRSKLREKLFKSKISKQNLQGLKSLLKIPNFTDPVFSNIPLKNVK